MSNQSNTFGGASVSGGSIVQGNVFNGNVSIRGSSRDNTDDLQCLRILKTVSPEDERRRILTVKDQLVTASYSWILENETFQSWLNEDTNHLLWIKGGPGKGKTMMMAGLVEVLPEARNSEGAIAISYFFCQTSDTELRKVTSIVKGLIHMLAFRERSLVYHLKKKYEAGGEESFTGPRALFTLWHVLEDMLRDFHGGRVYLIVDGLDECDDPEFDDFLCLLSGCNVTTPGKIKWLVTSRPLPRIEDIIGPDQDRYRISLEIEAQHVSRGVETFITEKVKDLQKKRHWSEETTQKVHSYLQKNAEGTFLWVALVCQRLRRFPPWKVEDELTKLAGLQRGLDSFYARMMQVVRDESPDYADLCMKILRTTTLACRSLRLQELGTVVALPYELRRDDPPNFNVLRDLIERCGSFILVHEDTIYFVHQSAKDYLSAGNDPGNYTLDQRQEHSSIAERCLDTLNSCLKDHQFADPPSLSKQKLGKGESQLLSRIAYACCYWIHHSLESVDQNSLEEDIPNQGKISNLLDWRLIAWVHALGSLKEVTVCIKMIKTLLDIQRFKSTRGIDMMEETYRFLRQNRHIVEESPNQAYISALLFAPKRSRIRKKYQDRIPKWIRLRTELDDTWDACLETLLGHSQSVSYLTFSFDGSLLASSSGDSTTRLWDTETGRCLRILYGDSTPFPPAFSPNGRFLVTRSNMDLKLLDTTANSPPISLVGHTSPIDKVLFAPNSQILASLSNYPNSFRLWNVLSGTDCGVYESDSGQYLRHMAFSHDSKRIVIGFDNHIEVRDVEASTTVATLQGRFLDTVSSVQFSPDDRIVLCVFYKSIWLWNPGTTVQPQILHDRNGKVDSAKFSPDGSLIASTSDNRIVTLWQASTGNQLHVFTVSEDGLYGAMFSPDSKVVVTPLRSGAKSWDTTTGDEIASLASDREPREKFVQIAACSTDGGLFAEAINYNIRIWDVATGALRCTLEGHSGQIRDLEFSPTGSLVASASDDHTVKLWSLEIGTSSPAIFRNESTSITCVAISLDGSIAASVSRRGVVRLWDLESGSPTPLSSKCFTGVRELFFSPDNSLLAAITRSDLFIWETENGSLRYKYTRPDNNYFERITFSSESCLLKVEFYHSDTIQLLENHTREVKALPEPSHAKSTQPQQSPNGRFIVKPDWSRRTACLWEREGESEQETFRFKLGGAGGVATFSPDSKFIAFISSANFISVWEIETGACHDVSSNLIRATGVRSVSHDNRSFAYILRHLKLYLGITRPQPFIFKDPVKLVTFSPDSRMVAAVSGSAIVLWKTPSRPPAVKLDSHQKPISDITFVPDRNILIAGHEHGTIQSWDTNNYALLHTFHTEDRPPRFALDNKRNFLWTGKQGFFLNEVIQPQPCKKPAIFYKDGWVLLNGVRVLWLPGEFRPSEASACAASSKYFVIGCSSGELMHVHFNI